MSTPPRIVNSCLRTPPPTPPANFSPPTTPVKKSRASQGCRFPFESPLGRFQEESRVAREEREEIVSEWFTKIADVISREEFQGQLLRPLAQGDYTVCYEIGGAPQHVLKVLNASLPRLGDKNARMKEPMLEKWANYKNRQYELLKSVGIPVAETRIESLGIWFQERMPFLVSQDLGNFRGSAAQLPNDDKQKKILKQIKTIFKTAWDNRIDIDPRPQNFGYSLDEKGDPIVKLFDFREEGMDIGEIGLSAVGPSQDSNPLAPYLHAALEQFAMGSREIADYLDPRW